MNTSPLFIDNKEKKLACPDRSPSKQFKFNKGKKNYADQIIH